MSHFISPDTIYCTLPQLPMADTLEELEALLLYHCDPEQLIHIWLDGK